MATLVGMQPHWISLRLRVVLESQEALMSRQYLWGTATLDSSHIVHEVQIPDKHRVLQRIRALFHCGAITIFMFPQLLNRLGIPHEAVHFKTHGLAGQVIAHVRESRKLVRTVH